MNNIKQQMIQNYKQFEKDLEKLFNCPVHFSVTSNDDHYFIFNFESLDGNLEFKVGFYNVGTHPDYAVERFPKNEVPIIKILWLGVEPKRMKLGTKIYKEFLKYLPEDFFKRIILDANGPEIVPFWLSLDFERIGDTVYMFKNL